MSTFAGLIQRGTRSAQPAATTVAVGTLYCVTDESAIIERSTGAAWQSYSPTAGIGAIAHGRMWFAFRSASVPTGGTPIALGIGCSNPVVDGTTVDNSTADYSYAKFTSAVQGGLRWSGSANQAVSIQQNPTIRMQVKTHSTLLTTDLWAGIGTAEPTTSIANSYALMIRYIQGTDAGWVWAICNNTATVSTGAIANIATDTEYTLQIRCAAGIPYFSVDGGVTEFAGSGQIPTTTIAMNAFFIRAYSTIGNTVGINIAEGMVEYGKALSGLY